MLSAVPGLSSLDREIRSDTLLYHSLPSVLHGSSELVFKGLEHLTLSEMASDVATDETAA